MPRKLKPYKVTTMNSDAIVDRYGIEVDIFLDRNTIPAMFFAVVRGTRVSAPSQEEVEDLVMEALKESENLTWKKIIVIRRKVEPMSSRKDAIDIVFNRHEVAQRVDGEYVERNFRFDEGDPEYRKPSEFELDRRSRGEDIRKAHVSTVFAPDYGRYVIPYSAEAWQGLTKIKEALAVLGTKLDKLLGDEGKLKALTAASQLLEE